MALHRLVLDPSFSRFHVVFGTKDSNWVEKLGGKSVAKKYKPLSGVFFELTKGKPGDLFLLVGTPIVTTKAWGLLEAVLGPYVEALAVTVGKEKEKRFILNVLTRSDAALDAAACKGNHIAVHASLVPSVPIFGVARAAHVETIVDDTIKAAVSKAKLTGWKFEAAKKT